MIAALFLGLAIVMLIVAGTSLMQVRFEAWMLVAVFAGIALLALYRLYKQKIFTTKRPMGRQMAAILRENLPAVLLFCALLLIRVYQSANLFVPSWMDGLFHADLLEGFLQRGGIPARLGYHFGYHLLAFVHCKVFGWSNPQSLLLTGQWISTLFSLAAAYFVSRSTGSKRLALLSMLVLTLFSSFPAYLINWSRYSILLGGAFVLVLTGEIFFPAGQRKVESIVSPLLLLAGLVLSHYTSIALAVFLWVGILLLRIKKGSLQQQWTAVKNLPSVVRWLSLAVLLGIGFFLLSKVAAFVREGEFSQLFLDSKLLVEQYSLRYFWQLANRNGGWVLLVVGAGGLICMAWKEKRLFGELWLGMGLLLVFVFLQIAVFQFSQPSLMNVFIWLFVPLSISAAFAVDRLLKAVEPEIPHIEAILFAVLLGAGFIIAPAVINPVTVLYTLADHDALVWMQANIEDDQAVLINADYFISRQQPEDGGGWLSYLADVHTIYPSQEEAAQFPDWFAQADVEYIYQGVRSSRYDLSQLDVQLELVFAQDTVRIYRVVRAGP